MTRFISPEDAQATCKEDAVDGSILAEGRISSVDAGLVNKAGSRAGSAETPRQDARDRCILWEAKQKDT
ncbi:hypothetical protein NDU88_001642 [Pleurodeles waltl]|uniref:Uncharacterized protein n=1 Tax=Pleurodeles waltl TaxID=8319 RepID=A0AAV7T0T0_PLEWA|nr:hypothetical protein NDU88_001642 [Pleurodeles waltl]